VTTPFRSVDEGHSPRAVLRALLWLALMQGLRVVDTLSLLTAPRVLRAHLRAGARGMFNSPHLTDGFARVEAARRAQLSKVELTYGETPIVTARAVLRRAGVDARARVVDLGCGRGRVLLAARALGAEARGIDLLPAHTEIIRAPYADAGIVVEDGDATRASLGDATHVFVTWTCMSEHTRDRLTENLKTLAPGTRVLTVTHPVDDDAFPVVDEVRAVFSWGIATIFVHARR